MAYIRQRNKKDCGVAALAMLCGVTYDEANHAIPWRRVGHLYGTSTSMLAEGATKLGYKTRGTPTGRLGLA
jgi:ABC-type bacteriocin/lantibiotic exporter with double-glycine peptidase domain